jgi:hypothetical protein
MQANPRALAALFKHSIEKMFNQQNDDRPLRTGFPHASAILARESEFCLRRLVLLATKPEHAERPETKPWDSHQNAVFLNGWCLHEKYQKLLERYGHVVYFSGKPELDLTHFDETRLIYWSPDAVVEHCGENMVVEIKGYKQESYEKLDEFGDAPHDAHLQANLYMHLLELKHAYILVENKNTQDFKVWCVEYDCELVQLYLDRMYHFKAAYSRVERTGKLPVRCCKSANDRLAEKCPVRAICFKEKN